MLRTKETLRVFVNPFAAPLDKHGQPCALPRFDPETGRPGEIHWIGGHYERTRLDARGNVLKAGKGGMNARKRLGGVKDPIESKAVYDMTVQPVTHTDWHIKLVREGALVPADAATAKLCGVAFQDPRDALEEAKRKVIAEYVATYLAEPPVGTWPDLSPIFPVGEDPGTRKAPPVAPPPAEVAALAKSMGAGHEAEYGVLYAQARALVANDAEAIATVYAFSRLYSPASAKAFDSAGVLLYEGAAPRLPSAVVADALAATGGDPVKMRVLFGSALGCVKSVMERYRVALDEHRRAEETVRRGKEGSAADAAMAIFGGGQ